MTWAAPETARPLTGVRVLDLSTLLPGPLATLLLAEAGADVVKVERPGAGDEMRSYTPKLGNASANYAVLNRGKRAYAADLKDPAARDRVLDLAAAADVVVEQFRPGVADRLGLGYRDVNARNPAVVYCSISGFGQHGRHVATAGHDLNYLAMAGLLGVVRDSAGVPPLPPTVIADIAGGTYPAVLNILLALRSRDQTGRGTHLDVSMTHNLQMLSYGYFATHQASGRWPVPGAELLTGGSPRYRVYPTADGGHVAVAALEQKFWDTLVELTDLPEQFHDDSGNERAVIEALAARIGSYPTEYWRSVLAGHDACAVVVADFAEAVDEELMEIASPDRIVGEGFDVGALRIPVAPEFRGSPAALGYPELQELPPEPGAVWPD